jgi:hypothetical protein
MIATAGRQRPRPCDVSMTTRVRDAPHRRTVMRSNCAVAVRRLCRRPVAVELAHETDHGIYRDQQSEGEREVTKGHDASIHPAVLELDAAQPERVPDH